MGRQKNRRTTNSSLRKPKNAAAGRSESSSAGRSPHGLSQGRVSAPKNEKLVSLSSPSDWPGIYWAIIAGLGAAILFSYWPTIRWMKDSWINQPDYSHGWVVPLLALLICYFRSGSFPGVVTSPAWAGLSLVGLAILMRLVSSVTYTEFLDGWSILAMIAGMVWCLLGPRCSGGHFRPSLF